MMPGPIIDGIDPSTQATKDPPQTTPLSVSVVIPCYNSRRWIGATLRSVLSQDEPPAEVIVVDDGSSDGSADYILQAFPSVRVVRQLNAGAAAARNRGVLEANGEWVAFIDADDLWLPDKLRRQRESLARHPQAQMCYSGWAVCGPEVELPLDSAVTASASPGPCGWIYCELLLDCVVWTSTAMIQRGLFRELGGFDTQLRVGEDYDLWLRASRCTPILRVAETLAIYRQHAAGLTHTVSDTNWQALVVTRALDRWGYEGPDHRCADAREVAGALARTWSNHAFAHLQRGSRTVAARACIRALTLRWNDLGTWKLAVRSALGLPRRRRLGR